MLHNLNDIDVSLMLLKKLPAWNATISFEGKICSAVLLMHDT